MPFALVSVYWLTSLPSKLPYAFALIDDDVDVEESVLPAPALLSALPHDKNSCTDSKIQHVEGMNFFI